MLKVPSLAILAASFVTSSIAAQIGSVMRAQKLNEVSGGIVGPIAPLGYSLAAIGDLNGDGVGDLVAGLPKDSSAGEDHGALLVLFLNPNGTVAGQQKISEIEGGLTATLPDDAYFGIAIASPGDLDCDGLQELAVRAYLPQTIWILFLRANGTVRAQKAIRWSDPVYGGTTVAGDFISRYDVPGLTEMGDLDGDGLGDIAVGAPGDDDGDSNAGAIWVLYLNRDGTAKRAKKITQGSGGFDLPPSGQFGHSLARLGDVNGDSFCDISATAPGQGIGPAAGLNRWVLFLDDNQDVIGTTLLPYTVALGRIGDLDGDGIAEFASKGSVLFMGADGQPRKRLLISPGQNGMPADPDHGRFVEYAFAVLGDLDRDGLPELAASNYYDSQSGGAIWILSIARTAVRNGSGRNPLVYKEVAEPVVGRTWQAVLDCGRHGSSLAAIFGFERPLSGVFLPAGELLVDPASRRIFRFLAVHNGGQVIFSASVPPDPALISLQIYSQGACAGTRGVNLSNALYLLVGR